MRTFYGAAIDSRQSEYTPTPQITPVDDGRYLVNTIVPERFQKPATGVVLVRQMEEES
jgi:hypothetical protein